MAYVTTSVSRCLDASSVELGAAAVVVAASGVAGEIDATCTIDNISEELGVD
jgi:hypothetical protein